MANLPSLGTTCTVDLLHAPAGAPALLAFATGTRATPVGPCTLWLDGTVAPTFLLANADGFASIRLVVPPRPVFRGTPLFAQGFALDATAPVGVAFGNALRFGVGD